MVRCWSKRGISFLVAAALWGIAAHAAGGETFPADAPEADAELFQLSLSDTPVWLDIAPEPTTVANTAPLHQGTWDFEIGGAHMSPIRSTRDYFDAGSTALGYFIADSFSVNAAAVGYGVNQPKDGAFAGGFDLYARYYFRPLDHVLFYGDFGAGAFMADKEVPERGTHFNFTPRTGLGIGFRIDENVYVLGGARYWHLSNAGIHGTARNPSFDGFQYYVSVMLLF